MNNKAIVNYVLLVCIALVWGAQYALNDIALQTISPLNIAVSRAVIGSLTLGLFYLVANKRSNIIDDKIGKSPWLLYLLIALFESVIPLFLIAWGLSKVNSGVGAILMGMIPIFTMLIATIATRQERVSVQLVLSVLIGFFGIVILSMPNLHNAQSSLMGELAILLSAFSFSLSLILMKYLPVASPLKHMRNILGIAAIPLIVVACWFKDWSIISFPSSNSMIAITILGSFCTGIVYFMFMVLINRTSATFASLTNYLIPLVGVVIGYIYLHESLGVNELWALFMIFIALLVNQIKYC
ncbi:MAG: hypothetical protein QG673_1926 [Pseudomonadota bacterium]|nr:hypothetical protein [Pseudomonadota bacterium]